MNRRRAGAPHGPVTGVLVVDKPPSMTSHDVVSHIRRTYKTRRVGHAGTLDPMATGVLVLLLGEATKLSAVLTTQSKEYLAEITLGVATDSLDAEGKVVGRRPVPSDWQDRLQPALSSERVRTLQIPPTVSAVKVDGQRSYRLARSGQTVEHAPRPVAVHQLEVLGMTPDSLQVQLCVSKGYYVRSLARDLAEALGTVGHLTSLRRLRSGSFSLGQAIPLPLPAPVPLLGLVPAAREALPCLEVDSDQVGELRQGRPLPAGLPRDSGAESPGIHAAVSGQRLIALLELDASANLWRVRRGIHDPAPDPERQLETGSSN